MTPSDLRALAARLFPEGPLVWRKMQHWRPMIAPFHVLIDAVPQGSSVLDVGCGGGLFLMLLAAERGLRRGVGFDASRPAIALAQRAAAALPDARLDFIALPVGEPWPSGPFDVVSIIDLLHHVPPAVHGAIIAQAAERLRPGGLLLLKDMGERPLWRAWANVLHDLVLARQWTRIPRRRDILSQAAAAGLVLEGERIDNMLWYGHHLLVFRKPGDAS